MFVLRHAFNPPNSIMCVYCVCTSAHGIAALVACQQEVQPFVFAEATCFLEEISVGATFQEEGGSQPHGGLLMSA